MHELFYTLVSVIIVSLISLVGIIVVFIKENKLKNYLLYLVSFAVGALLGDTFIHLIPEISEEGLSLSNSLYILLGIGSFFILEKFVHWHHCHECDPSSKNKIHPFVYMNLIGDSFHNFLDGMIITAGYLVSLPVGIATTIAVILHEIPQEIGDFGVMLHGGLSKKKAIFLNFVTALTAVLGAITAFFLVGIYENLASALISFTIGGFVYIAASDLIPELHKEKGIKKSIFQLLVLILGVLVMMAMLLLE